MLTQSPDSTSFKQATLGLKSIYTILNSHSNAITYHGVQTAGLWDILPAAVASIAFSGSIYDGNGQPLRLNQYITLPGKGAIVIKGNKYKFILDEITKTT